MVAILDTGCGEHPWLDGVVTRGMQISGVDIGHTNPLSDSEVGGDLAGALDGLIDPLSGHGTFIAGLVHQACPDAQILSWRIVPSDDPIVESELVTSLAQIAELVRRFHAGEPGGQVIDVLSLSIGYYHETPADGLFDPTIFAILDDLSRHGTQVVCSAGNDATSRPSFPSAFGPWSDGQGPVDSDPGSLPIVSVGALNPNGITDALFSNVGPWVRAYVPGASVVSTVPESFQGGLQSAAATTAFGRKRDSIDLDDFRGGFAVWSGTSFAAPLLAGRVAAHLALDLDTGDDPAAARARARSALAAHTSIKPD